MINQINKYYTAEQLCDAMINESGGKNRIIGSVWSVLVEKCQAREVKNYIERPAALKSIRSYLLKAKDDIIKAIGERFGLFSASENTDANAGEVRLVKEENGIKYYQDNGKLNEICIQYNKLNERMFCYDPDNPVTQEEIDEFNKVDKEMWEYVQSIIGKNAESPNQLVYIESNGVLYPFGGTSVELADGYKWVGLPEIEGSSIA